jgi:Fe-S protein assembly co-chaperone HscB
MQLNEAYKVLGDDYKRAEYLLKLNNMEIREGQQKSALTPTQLEEILDQYEIIDEIEDIDILKQKEQNKAKEKEQLVKMLSDLFARKNFSKALDLTVRLKYLTNLVGNIKLKIKNANNRD